MSRLGGMWSGADRDDKFFLASAVVVPAVLWWVMVGRHKYSGRGMR